MSIYVKQLQRYRKLYIQAKKDKLPMSALIYIEIQIYFYRALVEQEYNQKDKKWYEW